MAMNKIFLSYSSQDQEEVELFDLALRRRGVPLWRDRVDLAGGRLADREIERAAREAAGFVCYLTMAAARSEWVRDRELELARSIAERDTTFGIVPIFREGKDEITEEMIRQAKSRSGAGAPPIHDLRGFNGYLIRPDHIARGRRGEELAAAADVVLGALLETIERQRGGTGSLRIGAATRDAPMPRRFEPDLLLDWTADYPRDRPPGPGYGEEVLLPALEALAKGAGRWPGRQVQLIPQCHLTMALALGFQFRRNTGANLEVVEVQSGDRWRGPRVPEAGAAELWTMNEPEIDPTGDDLALVIGVSQSIREAVKGHAAHAGLGLARALVFEPSRSASKTALGDLDPLAAHRMAVAVVDRLTEVRSRHPYHTVHLFYAGPPALAVLLGQQLSNVGPVQTYEWLDSQRLYRPGLLLRSA